MINTISISLIYGCHHYEPTTVSTNSCSENMQQMLAMSNGYQRDHLQLNVNNQNSSLNLADVCALQSKNLKDLHATECHSSKYKGSLNRIPASLPFIYERNEKDWTELELQQGTWDARIDMISMAFKCAYLFALSIVPKNPSIKQTWYFKKVFIHERINDFGGVYVAKSRGHENCTNTKRRDPQPKDFQGGFIKPFANYYTNHYRPTIDLVHLPSTVECEVITDPSDIEKIVQKYYPEQSQAGISSILNSFLKDSEATHVGLLTLYPPQQRIFIK